MQLNFESSINIKFYQELNDLLFFNHNQKIYRRSIEDAIDTYGLPRIIKNNNKITIQLDRNSETHNLFLLNDTSNQKNLIGVAIFIRENEATATLLHIAMIESSPELTLILILKVKEYLKNFKGMERLNIHYSDKISSMRII